LGYAFTPVRHASVVAFDKWRTRPSAVQARECGLKSLQVCALHVAQDEVGIVTAPFHLSAPSYFWLPPLWSATGIASTRTTKPCKAVGFDTSRQNEFRRISDYGGLYVPAASVAVDISPVALPTTTICGKPPFLPEKPWPTLSFSTPVWATPSIGRRPCRATAGGTFGRTAPGHAGWAVDALRSLHPGMVLCPRRPPSQYSGIATRLIVYSLATTVSASRVMAREHFLPTSSWGQHSVTLSAGIVVERPLHRKRLESLLNVRYCATPSATACSSRMPSRVEPGGVYSIRLSLAQILERARIASSLWISLRTRLHPQ